MPIPPNNTTSESYIKARKEMNMAESISLIIEYIDRYGCCNPAARLPDLYIEQDDWTLDISLHIFSPSFFCFFSNMFDLRLDVND